MKVCVLNGSPKGRESITLQYVHFLEEAFPAHTFIIEDVGQKIHSLETKEEEFSRAIASVSAADLVLFATPVYFMLVPAQFKRFIELVFSRNAASDFDRKYAGVITTSIHFFDHTAHAYLGAVAEDLGMQVLGSFSAKMDDLLGTKGQEDLLRFGNFLFASAEKRPVIQRRSAPVLTPDRTYRPGPIPEPFDTRGKSVLILSDAAPGSNLEKMVLRAAACAGRSASIVPLDEAKMKGGCLGCCRCAFDNTCVYDDGYAEFFTNTVLSADIVIFAGQIRDRYFSAAFKQFFDRSFFLGHVPRMGGKQIAVLAQGPYAATSPLPEIMAAYADVQGANLAGIVTDEEPELVDERIDSLVATCIRSAETGFVPPPRFPSVGGHKVFRDEIWGGMRPFFKADDLYYRSHGGYDFPQYRYANRIRTAFLALVLSIPSVRKEVMDHMKQHMLEPFARVFSTSPVLRGRKKPE
jgi:multimeric flavodoxin WrbA